MSKSTNKLEDLRIVEAVLAGDERKFSELLNKYEKAIFFRIKKYVRDDEVGRDLVQEVFEKVYVKLDTYNSTYAFSTWLYTIAERHTIDYLRKKKLETISIDKPVATKDGELEIQIPDSSKLPDNKIIKKERYNIVHNAIDSLPEKYKNVIKLRYLEELSYDEISEELGLPLGTVKAHIFRGKELLIRAMKELRGTF